ncbi:MAG: carbohydrate kinase family protein [bacterium]|nr:carbohydrate kinase family protein [bacterium]
MAAIDVVCAGVLVADVFVPPLERLPHAGELLATDDFWIDSGGCAANTATSLVKLGVAAAVAGVVGTDIYGDFVEGDLGTKGVDTAALRRTDVAGTSKTVILPVRGEDRRYIHTFGANADFRVADIPRDLVAHAGVLCVGGYLILPAFDPVELAALFAFARQQGVRTILDVVVTEGGNEGGRHWAALTPVLPQVDFFLPNNDEAQQLTGETDPLRQAQRLRQAGCGTAIVTLGDRGAVVADERDVVCIDGYAVEVVDGSGAGDAFAAGLVAGLLEGLDTQARVRLASAIGASACSKLGCTTGVFSRAEANAFLEAV